jgi:hypothetical protein
MYWTPAEHLTQLCCMAVVIFGAQAIGRRAQQARQRAETDRLRCILILGLASLVRIYRDNLDLLPHRPRRLITGRPQMALLRIHLGRLTHLETTEVEAVMGACIAAEHLETHLEIAGRHMGAAAASIPRRNEVKASIKATMVDAVERIEEAINALDPIGDVRRRTEPRDISEVRSQPAPVIAASRIPATVELRPLAAGRRIAADTQSTDG